jgi:uncharacterized phage protein (TIGR01671 family)
MRDIKCRAFSTSMGTYFKDHNGNTRYFVAGDGTELFTTDIVEMFTGLKDMTGKEIYEGDIVWHDALSKSIEVTYGLQHVDAFEGYGFNLWSHYGAKQDGSRLQSELKVIGNIHEHKDLIR